MSSSNQKLANYFSLIKQALKGGNHDFTSGSLKKAIFLLAIPMILELSLESVFAVVDMFFVGKLGDAAIATVGLTEAAVTIIYSAAIGLSTAATAIIARRIGEKNPEDAAHAAVQAIVVAFIVTIFFSLLGIVFAEDILRFMGAQKDVIEQGTIFTRIMLGGSVAIIMLFLINGIFRGAGNAAMAMKSLWLASLLNIILCPLLIYGIGSFGGFGLKGAAIATTIGRSVGVLFQCYFLFKGEGMIRIKRKHINIDFTIIKSLIKIAWPATFQFIIASGSWIIMARLVAETGGTIASAGYQIAIRNVVFFILPAWGLSNAAATLVGQNLGAQLPERAEKSVLLTAKYNAYFMAFVSIIFVSIARNIISIFTTEIEVINVGTEALQIIGSGFIFYGIGMVMVQALNGAGDTKTPTWINIFSFWLFQIPLAYLLAKYFNWGPKGAFWAIPIAETTIALTAFYFFKKGKWKLIKV